MIAKKLNRILDEFALMQHPDQFILSFPNLPATKNIVNVDYFHAEYPIGKKNAVDSGRRNLGDVLSPVVVEYMLQRKNIIPATEIDSTKHLYAIGSILLQGYQNATVWGSGFLTAPSSLRKIPHSHLFRKLDIRCVRGPHTKNILEKLGHHCPEVYGDPGVLMPLIYQPEIDKTDDYIIIPHFSTEKKLRTILPENKIVSMNTSDHKSVIDKIVSADKVVTSSLHGIILAEAYGVPAVFYMDRPAKFDFKYADWYASTNRDHVLPIRNLEDAIHAEAPALPDVSSLQENLLNSFPYDLWNI